MKLGSPQYESEFWKGHWSQYELRLNTDEQQDDKKFNGTMRHRWGRWSFRNYSWQNPHEKVGLCVWHVTNHWHWQMNLNKLSEEEHTELWWNYCGNIFRNRKEVDNHIFEACKLISSECPSKYEVENYNGNIVADKEE